MHKRKKPPRWMRKIVFGLLRHLPGPVGFRYGRRFRKLYRNEVEAEFRAALLAEAGTTFIDLGANVGEYTALMAKHAGHVYAIEPDPWTVQKLRANTAHLSNVTIIEAAVGTGANRIKLYRRAGFTTQPERHNKATSIIADKKNMSDAEATEVDQIDFLAFLGNIKGRVGVVKMDIEGAEVPILEALFASDLTSRIGYLFCETHETSVPRFAKRTGALRKQAKRLSDMHANLDWH